MTGNTTPAGSQAQKRVTGKDALASDLNQNNDSPSPQQGAQTLDVGKLRELQERVKAATGPDREIDRDLWLLFGWNDGDDGDKAWAHRRHMAPTEEIGGYTMSSAIEKFPHDKAIADYWNTPHLTDSLDAALGLVERVLPEWGWNALYEPLHGADGYSYAGLTPPDGSRGPSVALPGKRPALALLSALLSTLSNKGEEQ